MRNLIFAKSIVTSGAVSGVTTEGAFGIAYYQHNEGKSSSNNKELKFISSIGNALDETLFDYSGNSGADISPLNFVLIRSAEHGGNVLIPFHPNHYHFVRGDYQAATTFAASIVIPAPDSDYYDYTIIAVKKGKKFKCLRNGITNTTSRRRSKAKNITHSTYGNRRTIR